MTAKSFSLIPGPRSYPILGTLPNYFFHHPYSFDRLHLNGLKKYLKYGPIVREEIVPGTNIVWLYRPEDIKTMFDTEGDLPSRRSHVALQQYRMSKPEVYGDNAGLLPTNGEEWRRIRRSFQFRATAVQELLPEMNEAASELCDVIRSKISSSPVDMTEELKKYFLEITVLFLFGIRIGSIRKQLPEDSASSQLLRATLQTNENILKTDNGLQLWRWIETSGYRSIRTGQECIERIAEDLMRNHRVRFPFKEECINEKDVFTFVSDMLLAGVDTSSYTTGFLLYHLARNKDKQIRLRDSLLLSDESSYCKMSLRESLRLNPISVGVGRICSKDTVFSGYLVPEGTVLVTQNQVSCRLPEYFDRPDEFVPERWERGGTENKNNVSYHPYLSLPFGHGKRMCIGRRLAEQSILVLVGHLFRGFELSWHSGLELDCLSKLINKPDKPLLFDVKEVR